MFLSYLQIFGVIFFTSILFSNFGQGVSIYNVCVGIYH